MEAEKPDHAQSEKIDKKERLAEALRQNLLRRKAGRKVAIMPESGSDPHEHS